MDKPPIIFLAFANDRQINSQYLRNLPLELDGIRKALRPLEKAGVCKIVERANATLDQIIEVFQDSQYQNRIAIFHYGGHAESYKLLLEDSLGTPHSVSGRSLNHFISASNSLN